MSRLQTGKIFKNEFSDFKKYYKIKNKQKLYLNNISFDVYVNEDILTYNLKYFKVIIINKFENDFSRNSTSINNVESTTFNKYLNSKNIKSFNPLFNLGSSNKDSLKSLQSKISIIGNNKIFEKSTEDVIKKYLPKTTFENIINFNEKILVNDKINFLLTLKNSILNNQQNRSEYDFFIYAYDYNENIIDTINILNQNIEEYIDLELFKNPIQENINNISHSSLSNFSIKLDRNKQNIEKIRSINIEKGNDLFKNIKNFNKNNDKLINKITVSEILNGKSLQTFTIDKNFEKINQVSFDTNFKIMNDSNLKYLITTEYTNKNVVIKNIDIDIPQLYIKNKEKDEVILDRTYFKSMVKKFNVFYLQKEKIFEVELEFDNIVNSKFFDPLFESIVINNNEVINNCYFDKEKKNSFILDKQNLIQVLKNSKDNKIKFYVHNKLNINVYKENSIKIQFKKKFDQNEIFFIESKVNIIFDNIQSNNKFYAYLNYTNNIDMSLNSNFTKCNLKYVLDITNVNDNEYYNFKNKSIENYIDNKYSEVLSDSKKNNLSTSISLNNFYIIVKKNIHLEKNMKNEYFYLSELPIKNDEISFEISDNNIKNFIEIYTNENKFKEVFFESKIFVVPNNVYEKNEFLAKNIVKSIVLSRKSNVIPDDEKINQIYSILKKINLNGTDSLSSLDINFLYDFYCFDYSYAKTPIKVAKKLNQNVNINKNILINEKIFQVDLSKKIISFNIDLNVEELNRISLKKELLIESLNKSVKNIFSEFVFKQNKDFIDIFDSFFNNNKKSYFDQKKYQELINEIKLYSSFIFKFKTKNILSLEFQINLEKAPLLNIFLTYCKNIKKNLSLSQDINLNTCLYQKIKFSNLNLNYIDENNNTINLNIAFENNEIYLKYPDLTSI